MEERFAMKEIEGLQRKGQKGMDAKKRIISIAMTILLLLNAIVTNQMIVAESGQSGNSGVQVGKDVSHILGVKKIMLSGGKEIKDDDKVDIATGFAITLDISVPLRGDTQGNNNTDIVEQGDIAEIALSENVQIPADYNQEMYGPEIEVEEMIGGQLQKVTKSLKIGTVELIDKNDKVYAKITFNGDSRVFDGTVHALKLQHEISLQIDISKKTEEEGISYIVLVGKKWKVEGNAQFFLHKEGKLNEENQEICWNITAEYKNADGTTKDLAGYILEEDFSEMDLQGNNRPVLVQVTGSEDAPVETVLSWNNPAGNAQRFRYTFPPNSTGKHVFKIKTKLTDREFYLEQIQAKKNIVRLLKANGEEVKQTTASVNIVGHQWIEKSHLQQYKKDETYYVDWAITINQDKKKLKNVKIVDSLSPGVSFVKAYWEKGTQTVVDGKKTWVYAKVSDDITQEPANSEYDIAAVIGKTNDAVQVGGDIYISDRYRLVITTKFDLQGNLARIFANTATVKWGEGVEFSDRFALTVGIENLFTKKAVSDIFADPKMEWKISVKKEILDTLAEPKFYDLLVFDNAVKSDNLKEGNNIAGLPTGVAMNDLLSPEFSNMKFRNIQLSDGLSYKIHKISYQGKYVADLVEVTGNKDRDWDVSIFTLPMQKDSIEKNDNRYYYNASALYDGGVYKMQAKAVTRYQSLILRKQVLKAEVAKAMREHPTADLANTVTNRYTAWDISYDPAVNQFTDWGAKYTEIDKDNAKMKAEMDNQAKDAYSVSEKKVLFRLTVNANGHTALKEALGSYALLDQLPWNWEFTKVTDTEDFLIFRAEPEYNYLEKPTWKQENISRVKAVGNKLTVEEIRNLGIRPNLTGGYKDKFEFTFEKDLDGPYVIILAAQLTPSGRYKYYTEGGAIASNTAKFYTAAANPVQPDNLNWVQTAEESHNYEFYVKALEKNAILLPAEDRDGTVSWEIVLDAYQIITDGAEIQLQDTIGSGLVLKADTVIGSNTPALIRLYQYDDNNNTNEQIIPLEFGKNIFYNDKNGVLKVNIPDQSKRYRLSYLTEIRADKGAIVGADLNNTAAILVKSQTVGERIAKYRVLAADINAEYKKTGIIEVFKTDEETKESLAGAEFTLFQADGKEVEKKESNDKGYLRFIGIKAGDYYLKETKAPDGYQVLDQKYDIKVRDVAGPVVGVEVEVDGKPYQPLHIVNKKKADKPKPPTRTEKPPVPPTQPVLPTPPSPAPTPPTPTPTPTPTPPTPTPPAVPYLPETPLPPKKEIPPKKGIPLIPLVPATPIQPPVPYVPEVGETPLKPRVPEDILSEGITPHGDLSIKPNPKGPNTILTDPNPPFGTGELPKTDGLPKQYWWVTGLVLLLLGGVFKRKK